ncbi:kinase-like domain-containing protein [Ilyonectria robusta]|uniref:kinase-like domain-containing protein n=1 Tax=Ilyonectria robusta TaxID=1079257 RepID=UPI001E8CE13D|nr:kinase-like domain-containing protein [Ilyonectria robusta]KAH8694763.1 kinase-like domain-containing protein [Ilyonectria robusta]
MPQNDPPPIFSLEPLNAGAFEVLTADQNAHLRNVLLDGSKDVLSVGQFAGGESRYTLATIGRGTDANWEIMLRDWSTQQSTQVSRENANAIDGRGGIRQVVLDDAKPVDFGFGGPACNAYQFRLHWHMKPAEVKLVGRPDLPHNAPTALPTPATRIHPTIAQMTIRYLERKRLGGGVSGQVFKVVDVDRGHHVAMKRMDQPQIQSVAHARLKAEVNFLRRASHENVVEFQGYQYNATSVEIFTELMSGTVDDLMIQNFYSDHSPRVDTISYTGPNTHVSSLLHQTLKGLDYLATQKMVHLDIKPDNILYSLGPKGEYVYKLADFSTVHAVGAGGMDRTGTEMYRAPELSKEGAKAKTENDIWSLFVTMAIAMDTDGFRRKALYTTALRIIVVQEAADHPSMAMMSSMAKADPAERATAEEMLIKLFNGEGCKRKALSGAPKTTAASQRHDPYQIRQASRLAQQPAASEKEEMREMVREAQRHNDEMDWEKTGTGVQKE